MTKKGVDESEQRAERRRKHGNLKKTSARTSNVRRGWKEGVGRIGLFF